MIKRITTQIYADLQRSQLPRCQQIKVAVLFLSGVVGLLYQQHSPTHRRNQLLTASYNRLFSSLVGDSYKIDNKRYRGAIAMTAPSPALLELAHYLAGEFDNREQASAEPAWYVHLRLWHRSISLFEDSITLFAEQASVINIDQPYRQRIIRLRGGDDLRVPIQADYYMLKDANAVSGGGRNPTLLQSLTPDQVDFLPGCTLQVTQKPLSQGKHHFTGSLLPGASCCFTYNQEVRQVSLGFEVSPSEGVKGTTIELLNYDKGIDPTTGQALWGAILGPFRFTKQADFEVNSFT